MRSWVEIVSEARDRNKENSERKRRLETAKTRLKGSAAVREVQGRKDKKLSPEELKLKKRELKLKKRYQKTREASEKRKGDYFKWVMDQSRTNAEKEKQRKIKKIRDEAGRKEAGDIGKSLSKIKISSISSDESGGTAYAKALGNVASAGSGLGGAAVHGVRYLAAKKRGEAEAKKLESEIRNGSNVNIPQRRPRRSGPLGGRPSGGGSRSSGGNGTPNRPAGSPGGGSFSGGQAVSGPPSSSRSYGKTKRPEIPKLPPAGPKRLPPSGGMSKSSSVTGMSLGQQARQNPEIKKKMISQRNKGEGQTNNQEGYSNWKNEIILENSNLENLHEWAFLANLARLGASSAGRSAAGSAAGRSAAGSAAGSAETLGSKLKTGIKNRLKDRLANRQNSGSSPDSGGSNVNPEDSGATAYSKILNKIAPNESHSNWRGDFIIEVDSDTYTTAAAKSPIEKKRSGNGQTKKIIDVMRGKNKIELNPTIAEKYKDDEGNMVRNELNTMERAIKSIRKKVSNNNQQFPAWVQSKISKSADYIDTVSDYMMSETEAIKESYDEGDETFRQHSRETFSSHKPSESRKRTAAVLKLMKTMNSEAETKKTKKKKKKKEINECSCEDNQKNVTSLFKKVLANKKKKNFQLNSKIIGEAKSPAWQRKAGKNPEGGLNREGIASYRRENPGSKLSLAVTTKPSKLKKGSERWKRRKSFCARMGGMPGPMKDKKGRPTRKSLSLRKWNC